MTVAVKITVEIVLLKNKISLFSNLKDCYQQEFWIFMLFGDCWFSKKEKGNDLESGLGLQFCYCDELLQTFSLDFRDLEMTLIYLILWVDFTCISWKGKHTLWEVMYHVQSHNTAQVHKQGKGRSRSQTWCWLGRKHTSNSPSAQQFCGCAHWACRIGAFQCCYYFPPVS